MELLLALLLALKKPKTESPPLKIILTKDQNVIKVAEKEEKIEIIPGKEEKEENNRRERNERAFKTIKRQPCPEPPDETITNPRIRQIVQKHFPKSQIPNAMNVIRHESGFSPTARNPSSGACGLFQILKGTWKGYTSKAYSQCTNPELNIKIGYRIWKARGWWSPWRQWW